MKYCFVFVCQQGPLEIKSALLAASLRRNLRCDYELVAAVPGPASKWGEPAAETYDFLGTLGVRVFPIENIVSDDYPIGNKVSCLAVDSAADKVVFLDSDILCTREFFHEDRFRVPFNAKPADSNTFTRNDEVWRYVYQKFGLPLPEQRVIATFSREVGLPYFNAGYIAVEGGSDLAADWAEVCRQIDADPAIGMAGASIVIPPEANAFQRKAALEFPRFNTPVVDQVTDSDLACHSCCAFPLRVFEEVGREREDILRGLDPDLRVRLRR